jgi:hypothetical protein
MIFPVIFMSLDTILSYDNRMRTPIEPITVSGEFAEAGSWLILGYMIMNCQTLGQAIEKS